MSPVAMCYLRTIKKSSCLARSAVDAILQAIEEEEVPLSMCTFNFLGVGGVSLPSFAVSHEGPRLTSID